MVETIINIDIDDPRSSEIAEILSNKTCKKILSLIAEEELTETDISNKLNIPLNTVDYNTKKLINAGLIETTSHFWSIKGKKMPTYKISKKKIIISPKSFASKNLLLPLISSLGVLFVFTKHFFSKKISAEQLVTKSVDFAESSNLAMTAPQTTESLKSISLLSNFVGWEWLLIGLWIGIILFFIFSKSTNKN